MSSFTPCAPFHPKVLTRSLALLTGTLAGVCMLSGSAQGAGFALNESSASAAGTAYAGRAAAAQDASALASNPAAMSSLHRAQWTVGGAFIVPKGELSDYAAENGGSPVEGDSGRPFVKPVVVPGAYYVNPTDERVSLGIGVYVPFGFMTDYGGDFVGRYLADRSEVQNINVQPTLSFRWNENLSFGIGVFASFVDGVLTRYTNDLGSDMKITVKGDDWKAGFKLGALWDNGRTSVGLSWTSKVDFELKGNARLDTGGVPLPAPTKSNGRLKLTIPELFEIGGSFQVNRDWTLVAGAQWTGWSSFKEIDIRTDEEFVQYLPGDSISYTPENWKDVWSFSVGARYQMNPQWQLRVGYAFDESPVKDEYRTARIPDGDRSWVTIGARFQPDKAWNVDMAYGYLIPKSIKVSEYDHDPATRTPELDNNYQGKYKMSAHVAMLSLTHMY